MAFFDKAGFSALPHPLSVKAAERRARAGTVWRIRERAQAVLGPSWQARVHGFMVSKLGKTQFDELTDDELRMVIGWINRMDKYTRKGESK
jgi:hypothetical protein